MTKLGEILCGLLLVVLMAPIFLVGILIALFDVRHYLRNVFM